ncbi:MAG: hypothetical protein V8T09_03110 [Oscillospiraceae bacterium]
MKKFMAMLLALVMALSLVACGQKADDTAKDDANTDNTDDFLWWFWRTWWIGARRSPTVSWCRRATPRVCWRASTRPSLS